MKRPPNDMSVKIAMFFQELEKMIDGLDDEAIQDVDFKPLYAKYPRVHIGIRRALLYVRKINAKN